MKRIFNFTSMQSTLLKIVLMAMVVLAIIVAGGAPDCFAP
jgi:hypothetical protein